LKPLWQNLTPAEHEYQYNPQHTFPDFASSRARREPFNAKALQCLERQADIPYGEHPLRTLDIYPGRASGAACDHHSAPVHIFLHGGYWRAQDKNNFAFVAGTLVPLGITTVIMNYELCPASDLDAVVDSAVAGFDWLLEHISDYAADASCISLSGHSAGAHLGAAIIAQSAYAGRPNILNGALLSCGLYNPAPAALTSVNQQLQLTAAQIARHDFETKIPMLRPDVTLMAGSREPWQWVDQSFRYYHWLRRHGLEPTLELIHGRDHFDILDEYLDVHSSTVRTIMRHCGVIDKVSVPV